MLEQVFLMDLDLHGLGESITNRLVADGGLSQSKIDGLVAALSGLGGDITAEEVRALAAEGVIASDLAQEIADRIAAIATVQGNLDTYASATDGRLDVIEGSDSTVGSIAHAVKMEHDARLLAEAGLASDIAAEQTRAEGAEAGLQSAIDALDQDLQAEIQNRQDGDADTLQSAQSYADQKIADLVNSAPALLDTLGEIAAAINNDESFASTILNTISTEQTRAENAEAGLDSRLDVLEGADSQVGSVAYQVKVEKDRAEAAEAGLDGRLDTLEAKAWRQAMLTSNSQGVTSLNKPSGAPAIPNNAAEVMVFIDGRKVFFGSQFEVAVGGGSITFPALRGNQTVEVLYFA